MSANKELTPYQWADFVEAMADVAPTTEVPDSGRALLAIALCNPEWLPADCKRDAPHGVWERLTVEQWQALVRWSQLRKRRGDH